MKCIAALILSLLILLSSGGYSQIIDIVYSIGGDDTILKLEGGVWTEVDPGIAVNCGSLLEIWGSSSDNIYVTGCNDELLHYDGFGWQKITIPDATPIYSDEFYTVNGTGPNNIYVAGKEAIGFYDNIVYHYDGNDWSYVAGGDGWIRTLWADPNGGYYAITILIAYWLVGDPPYYAVLHFKDGQYTVDRMPSEYNIYLEAYYDITGAVGGYPFMSGYTRDDFTAASGGFLSRRTTYWSTIYYEAPCSPFFSYCPVWPFRFYGIWCESDTDVWFAGESGTVVHWTSGGYTEYDTGVTGTLRAIWGRSNSDVYAVGDGGTIVHFDGIGWTAMSTPTVQNLTDIWGHYEIPIVTLLQSFSTDTDAGHVTIRWSLSEIGDNTEFHVSRISGASAVPMIDNDPDIERSGLSFTYVDTNVEPEGEYTYIVEYSDGDEWIMLFDTGRVVVPGVQLALMPNYPNPFNPSTRITYSVPEHGHVSLRVYDVTGRLVRTIVDGSQRPGTYSVTWNGLNDQGRNAATGTYFCRLVAAKRAVTQKILLTR